MPQQPDEYATIHGNDAYIKKICKLHCPVKITWKPLWLVTEAQASPILAGSTGLCEKMKVVVGEVNAN